MTASRDQLPPSAGGRPSYRPTIAPDSSSRVRAVVVGGGVMGAAAAWQLARRGAGVTLLERFEAGHARGASHGSSRIFRLAYAEGFYVELARRALAGWRELEDELGGEPVLTLTGGVDHGDPRAIDALRAALDAAGVDHEVLDPDAASARWPGLRFDGEVLAHPDAGRLHADRAVAALLDGARRHGAEVRHGAPVVATGERSVRLAGGEELAADVVVVASGAWSTRLLGGAAGVDAGRPVPALRVTDEQPAHFPPHDPGMAWPSFIHHPHAGFAGPGGTAVYGLGSDDGVKVGFHGIGPEVDPDDRDLAPDPALHGPLREYVRAWLPGVDADRGEPVRCTYTSTPDHHPVIDRDGDVVVLAGFSGHGFKFGPAFGALAAGLALDGTPAPPAFALGPHVEAGTPAIR